MVLPGGVAGVPGLTCAVAGNCLGCSACRTVRTPSSDDCGTGYRCHSPLSQSPPATTSKEHFGLFVLAIAPFPPSLPPSLLPSRPLGLFTLLTAGLDCARSSMGSSCGRPLLDLWRLALMISADTSKGMLRILSWMLSCVYRVRREMSH